MSTLFASFANPSDAERAAGALLDHGARPEDISLIANTNNYMSSDAQSRIAHEEQQAKQGISTTTASDAAMGAAKGTMVGFGVGIAAALAALFVPGIGLVLGGGALATAVAGAGAAAVAGAAAGGVAGYLEDQGVGADVATHYSNTFQSGGSILAVAIPTGDMTASEVENYLSKYGASNIATSNNPRVLMDREVVQQPVVINNNPNVDPLVIGGTPTVGHSIPTVNPVTGTVSTTAVPAATPVVETVVPTVPVTPRAVVDPVTGQVVTTPTGVVAQPGVTAPLHPTATSVDPLTGNVVRTAAVEPGAVIAAPLAGGVVAPASVDPLTGQVASATVVETAAPINHHPTIRATRLDPVTGQMLEGVMIDPLTGVEKTVFVTNGVVTDASGTVVQTSETITQTSRVIDAGRGGLL
jgi:uncharacterized membrane protein